VASIALVFLAVAGITLALLNPLSNAASTTTSIFGDKEPAGLRYVSASGSGGIELGLKFTSSVAGEVLGVRFYKSRHNTGTHTGTLWTSTGKKLASVTFSSESKWNWQTALFATPVRLTPGVTYVVSYHAQRAYSQDPSVLRGNVKRSGPLTAVSGVYRSGPQVAFPSQSGAGDSYAVDILFKAVGGPSTTPIKTTTIKTTTTKTTTTKTTTTLPTSTQAFPGTSTDSIPASLAAWPGPSNTGVPAGTVLHSCPTTITVTGTYDSCRFDGSVTVKANNVVISRSLVIGQIRAGSGSQQTGLLVKDTTVDARAFGSTATTTPPAVSYANFTLLRVNIFGSGHGVQTNGNAVIRDSWIHDLCCTNVAHKDGIISNGGSNVTVVHNNVECAAGNMCSAALGLFGDFKPLSHWTVENNLFNTTGGFCAYGGDIPGKKYPTSTYMVFRNNTFGNKYNPGCGTYGPIGDWTTNTGDVWTGNLTATGQVVKS
jgi:hypothetical protein